MPTFRPKIWDPLGIPPPKVEKIVLRLMCTIIQNFTPIGVTVAEIPVTGQKKTYVRFNMKQNA